MNKQFVVDIILIILIGVLIITTIFLLLQYNAGGFSCLANPIDYYERLKNVSCSCHPKQVWESTPINISMVG